MVWATPRTKPPSSVPHRDPKPPMTTASKAKMSWVGPLEGSTTARMARKAPARAAVTTAMPAARAYTLRESTPTSSAVSGSWAVARMARPSEVRARNRCSPPSTIMATPRMRMPRAEMESWSVMRQLAVVTAPALPPSERTSGEKASRSRFSITIPRPKVVSKGMSMPERRLRSSRTRCRAQPTPNMTMSAKTRETISGKWVLSTSTQVRKAPRTARSPWARLMMRMTPNIKESPQASKA